MLDTESGSENSISHDISQHCNALEDFDLLSGQTRGKHKDGRRENILDLLVFAERWGLGWLDRFP